MNRRNFLAGLLSTSMLYSVPYVGTNGEPKYIDFVREKIPEFKLKKEHYSVAVYYDSEKDFAGLGDLVSENL